MRSKATQRIRDRKQKARQRKNVRCHNTGELYGNAARLQQETVDTERKTFWMALGELFAKLNRGPRHTDQKDWQL